MIIGLVGAKGSGKSSVFASHLIKKYQFHSVSHADPIKEMVKALGLSEDHVNGALKDVPCKILCGKTPRWAMQSLGSEWGRGLIDPDLWIHLWAQEAKLHKRVVADGVRFVNEVDAIRNLGGITIKIRRPSVEGTSPHATEMYSCVLKTDYEIFNEEENPEQGLKKLDHILSQHLRTK